MTWFSGEAEKLQLLRASNSELRTVSEVEPGFRKAANLGDLEEGESIEVEVGPLPLHLRDGRIHATGAYCPRQDVRLFPANCSGNTILCTAHGYRMDLKTGACLAEGDLRMPSFPALVENGEVWVKLF